MKAFWMHFSPDELVHPSLLFSITCLTAVFFVTHFTIIIIIIIISTTSTTRSAYSSMNRR
jgi:hypothetical protein